MEKINLTDKTDREIESLWNELAICFERIRTNRPNNIVVGFFQLSKETKRRGLEMGKDKFGKIILEPIKQTA